MRQKIILCAALCAALAAVGVGAAFSREKLATQNSNQQTRKEREDRDGEENEEESEAAEKQAKLAKKAKITLERAREIALQRAPGTVEEAELEREKGKLVYSFDIRNERGTITEVLVNAKDGSIVGVEEEDAQKEAEEKRREEREKAAHKKRP